MLFFRNTISNFIANYASKGGSVFSAPFIHFPFRSKSLFFDSIYSVFMDFACIGFIAATKHNTQDKQH